MGMVGVRSLGTCINSLRHDVNLAAIIPVKLKVINTMQIGLFYGSTTCYTEMAAEKIQEIIGKDTVTLFNIKDEPLKKAEQFDFLIFGISTWDFGELQEDWESHWDDIETVDLSGKVIALFGMGDQQGYGEWFQDALGMLHDKNCTTASDFLRLLAKQ